MPDSAAALPHSETRVRADANVLAPRMAALALSAGVLGALLVPGARAGLGLSVAAVAVLATAAAGARSRHDAWQVTCLVAAALLAAAALFRDATWLVAGDLVIALILASVALAGGHSWMALISAPATVASHFLVAPAAVLRGALELVPRGAAGSAFPALRGAVLGAGLVVVFGMLFASADGAFAHLAGELVLEPVPIDDLPLRMLVGLAAVVVAGGLAMAGRKEDSTEPKSAPKRTLAPTEWGLALGALVALFAAFVGIQFVVLFGGHRHVLETAGLTYAEYAREGFAQLLVVAVLVIAVVAGAWRWSRLETPRHRVVLNGLLVALCCLTLVILVAALHRLDLYVDAFGATRLRIAATATCAWIGGLLALVLAGVLSSHRRWLPRASAILTAVVAVAFTAINPDARVAERNVDRFEQEGRIDVAYNASLSADATPALAALPEYIAGRVLAEQRQRLEADDGWRGLNIARIRARDALSAVP